MPDRWATTGALRLTRERSCVCMAEPVIACRSLTRLLFWGRGPRVPGGDWIEPWLKLTLRLAQDRNGWHYGASDDRLAAVPFVERHRLRAELLLVGMVTDRKVVDLLSVFDRCAHRVFERQDAGGRAAEALDVRAEHQHHVRPALNETELDGNDFAGHGETFRTRETSLRTFDCHAAAKREDRPVRHHVMPADRLQPRRAELAQDAEGAGDLVWLGEPHEFDRAQALQPAPLHPEIAPEALGQRCLAPSLPVGRQSRRIGREPHLRARRAGQQAPQQRIL